VTSNVPDEESGEGGPPPNSLSSQGIAGLLWSLTSVGGQAILQVIVLMVLARRLTPEEFGIVGIAVLVTTFSQALSEIGVGPALVQRSNLSEIHIRAAQFLSLLFAAVFAVAIWTQAHLVAAFFDIDTLAVVLPVYASVFLLRGISLVPEALLQRELKLRLLAAIDLCAFLFGYAAVGITLAMLGYGLWALVGAHIGQALVKTIGLIWMGPGISKPSINLKAAAELLQYGAGQSIGRLAGFVAVQGDSVVVGKLIDAQALGVYGRAYQLVVMPIMLLGRAVDRVLFPAMSKLVLDRERLRMSYRRGLSIAALLTMPTLVIFVVLAPEVVLVLLGSQWESVVTPLKVMACGLTFHLGYKVSDALIKATGAVYRRAWWQMVYAALVIVLASIAAQWGIVGVACATLAATSANYFFMVSLACKLTELKWIEVLRAHVWGLKLGLVTGLGATTTAVVLREFGAPGLVTLLSVLAATSCLVGILVVRWRDAFLGEGGYWFVARLSESLPGSAGRIVARAFRID